MACVIPFLKPYKLASSLSASKRFLGITETVQKKATSPSKKEEKCPPKKDVKCEETKKDASSAVGNRRVFKVYRFHGTACGIAPKVQSFELDISTCGRMMLDVLMKLKDMDPTLTFRRSCREGICGSCSMNIHGRNRLACLAPIPNVKVITIYPVPHMYVIRDLVVDMTFFLKAYDSIRPYIIRRDNRKIGDAQYAQSLKDNKKMEGLYECVLCGCCSTACPSYWWNGRRFLGPCALLHAYRWVIDTRDEDTTQRLYDLRDDFKAFRCHTIMNCTVDCPKGLHPAKAIAKLKRLIAGLDKVPPPEMDPLLFSKGKGDSTKCPPTPC